MDTFNGNKGYTIASDAGHGLIVKTWKNLEEMKVSAIKTPTTIAEIQEIVRDCSRNNIKIKCIGAGHSFTSAAVVDDGGILLSLENLDKILVIGEDFVTVQAGCTLAKLVSTLKKHNLMLPACPEYGPFSVGAICGTHFQESTGNMKGFATISSHVIAYKVITADGNVQEISDDLEYWRTNQGLGGVVVETTFRVKLLQKALIEFSILPWKDFWEKRDALASQYDEFFSIYIPLIDGFFIEKRKFVNEYPAGRFQSFKIWYGFHMRRTIMIKIMPWFFSSLQFFPSKLKYLSMKLGVDWIYRIIFTHSYFYATGGDRGYAFKSRPEEVYNDYMYDNKDYKAVMEELRDFLLQENSITSAVLVASYAVAKDNSCVMSRTKYGDCFCIDPVLTGPFNSPMHKLLQDKIEQIALRTNARPHLNKVTNLSSANIKAAYKQEDLQAYINWCNKQDSKGLFQGKFYRLLTEALS